MSRALVLGGGLAGMLAAAALTGTVDEVVVLERDTFPDTPEPRRGLPQGHHSHILMRGGVEAIDELLPGTVDELYAAGAKKRGLPSGALARGPEGWMERLDTDAYLLLCSRDLLDHIVRRQVLGHDRIAVREATKVLGLTGGATRVTGVLTETPDGEERLDADLVVDATGRGSHAPAWLTALGLPEVREDVVDAGVTYVSRWFEAPPGTKDDFPGVMIQMTPGTGEPGQGAGLLPMEEGRWILSLFGSRGGEPPNDEEGFARFARERHHPIIADLIAQATPSGPIRTYRNIPDRRRRYEKLPLPDGFVVIGDAASALNPVHGTGMSVAAQCARLLRDELADGGLRPKLTRRVQAGIARINGGAWRLAVNTDQGLPGVRANVRLQGGALADRMAARVARTGCRDPHVINAVFSVASLVKPMTAMMSPAFLLAVLRGPRKPALTSEEAIAQFPEFGDLLPYGASDRPTRNTA
ncbi:pyridine nucleotide-disulfide oxidoreductase [Streptomyces sp. SS1-1]|uniref:NAD(P)/FAD-dependent oxidoreductase n=1 Tax=Streptomyces sp. SS1-1 TaxID=2651869 RepID=UPI001250AC44|nr:FAD-dependent monooxygenase [Streptomyces sp. SS1-1]KAB2970937.1 pyridine nucleotide-disulfide oxidoreductase [Streptomyces sp. SS1-1]